MAAKKDSSIAAPVVSDKKKALETAMAQIERAYGKGSIMRLGENTQTVGTGNKLAVYVGDTLVQQYEIVVYGDINGDGKVSNLDLVLMQKQILGIESQSGSRLEAANVSKDGGISNKDLVILQKHILGISQIDQ